VHARLRLLRGRFAGWSRDSTDRAFEDSPSRVPHNCNLDHGDKPDISPNTSEVRFEKSNCSLARERKTSDFRPSKLPLLSILYSGVSWRLSRRVFSSPLATLRGPRWGGQ